MPAWLNYFGAFVVGFGYMLDVYKVRWGALACDYHTMEHNTGVTHRGVWAWKLIHARGTSLRLCFDKAIAAPERNSRIYSGFLSESLSLRKNNFSSWKKGKHKTLRCGALCSVFHETSFSRKSDAPFKIFLETLVNIFNLVKS